MTDIDWNTLRQTASEVMTRAYAPYSGYPVGAAALVDSGRIVSGCNVENVSYGLALCAECTLVGNLIATGGGRLLALLCCDARGETILPCGRCRQVLYEHGGGEMLIDTPAGPMTLAALLPLAFGPDDLDAVVRPGAPTGE
ncbi:cytidine deaminase [Millisia brevis]|uniref:cytidine deaminase n=1 Tax=Millisia brevis TaxID=264148 RepID=UPI0008304CFB|nr:cytidine deaminase [Millisia brevis]